MRGQLEGRIPATLRELQENPEVKVDVSGIQLTDLGDFDDLRMRGHGRRTVWKKLYTAGNNG